MQARYLTKYAHYEKSYLSSPRFVCGVIIFLIGMAINIHSDHILRNLRKPGETGYRIPRGRLFPLLIKEILITFYYLPLL